MYENDELVKIKTLEKEHECLLPLIKDIFKDKKVQFQIKSNYDTAYDGIFIGQKGVGSIFVFKRDKTKAEKLLKQIFKKNT